MSINDKLENVRKPRVHIKYEVETEGGQLEKELPFVVGVLGDYSGNNPGEKTVPLKERKFVNVDADNIDNVMQKIKPGVRFNVENKLDESNSELRVDMQFNQMEDFEPHKVVENIPALKALKESRDQLRDLLTKADRSDELENLLEDILQNNSKLKSLINELDKTDTE
jgi:type VI secretion system protein ImpB